MKKIVILIISGMLLLTGCYAANVDEVETDGSKVGKNDISDNNIVDVETKIDKMDEKDNHITIELINNLSIDADVTEYSKYSDKKFGIYLIEECEEIENNDFYKLVEAKYGNDAIITPEEAEEAYKKDKNTSVRQNVYADKNRMFLEFKSSPFEGAMDFFTLRYPNWKKNIDENAVKKAIDEACEIMNQAVDIEQYELVRYIYADEEWYSKAEVLGIEDALEGFNAEEHYAIRYMQVCEGIPIITDSNRFFNKLGDGCWIDLNNYFDIYIDGERNLMGYEYSKKFQIKDGALEYIEVINAKEVVESIYREYENTYISKPIEFYDIELVYSGDLTENKNGELQKCIRPYWIARYVDEELETVRYLVIDGESGEIVFNY